MNLVKFDQTRKDEESTYGEAVRLSNEFRSKPASTVIDFEGNRRDIPAQIGFDVETCDISKIDGWLADGTKKKSQSQITFLLRVLAVRYPDSFAIAKRGVAPEIYHELELIESEARNEVEWIGEVGFQNMVRLDGSLDMDNIEVIRKDDNITSRVKR